ncbi:MAG: 1,4-dihydroxy-2-naphthoate polyprenyltransferase [Candidatus Sericytochromatia bacterium]
MHAASLPPWKIWWLAARPRTLGAALAPVLIGTALALGNGHREWLAAFAAALGATLIQIGTNFANDYFDFRKGADTPERVGPMRVTQAGLVSPEAVRNAFVICFALVALPGLYLLYRGGWPIGVVGVLSVLSGILYTGGPFALAYLGLGDLFVLIFFGLVATGGSYYVQAGDLPPQVLLAGLAPGLLSMAILTVNNLRDRLTDVRSHKNTLVVRFGPGFARAEYLFCWLGAAAVPWLIYLGTEAQAPGSLLASAVIVLAIPALRKVFRLDADPALNPVLGETNRLLLIYSLVFSLGWLLGGVQ